MQKKPTTRKTKPIPTPKALNENIAKSMRSNTSKDTGPERIVRKYLSSKGIKGYRLNWKKAPGKPDIAFVGKKIAVFVHGCFWHRCVKCDFKMPKNNRDYWRSKFKRNTQRDAENLKFLKKLGWRVFVIRECEIKKGELEKKLLKVSRYLNQNAMLG